MKILQQGHCAIHLIGGGSMGISHPTDAHIYLIRTPTEAALIDAGSGIHPQRMLANLAADQVNPEHIRQVILTHSHWDHGRGSAWWQQQYGAQILVHRLGQEAIESGAWPASHISQHGIASQGARVSRALDDGDSIAVGDLQLQVIHTPGHSDDSIALLLELEQLRILFSGDTAFAEGCHGTVSAETDFRAYRNSACRLADLQVDVLLPGHKQFVLSRAHEHVQLLAQKMSGRWTDVTTSRVPFFPTWWLEHDARLYDDAR